MEEPLGSENLESQKSDSSITAILDFQMNSEGNPDSSEKTEKGQSYLNSIPPIIHSRGFIRDIKPLDLEKISVPSHLLNSKNGTPRALNSDFDSDDPLTQKQEWSRASNNNLERNEKEESLTQTKINIGNDDLNDDEDQKSNSSRTARLDSVLNQEDYQEYLDNTYLLESNSFISTDTKSSLSASTESNFKTAVIQENDLDDHIRHLEFNTSQSKSSHPEYMDSRMQTEGTKHFENYYHKNLSKQQSACSLTISHDSDSIDFQIQKSQFSLTNSDVDSSHRTSVKSDWSLNENEDLRTSKLEIHSEELEGSNLFEDHNIAALTEQLHDENLSRVDTSQTDTSDYLEHSKHILNQESKFSTFNHKNERMLTLASNQIQTDGHYEDSNKYLLTQESEVASQQIDDGMMIVAASGKSIADEDSNKYLLTQEYEFSSSEQIDDGIMLKSNLETEAIDNLTQSIEGGNSLTDLIIERETTPELDDETGSFKTKPKNTTSLALLGHDTDTPDTYSSIKDDIDGNANSFPLTQFFEAQRPVVELDMIDQSITSGMGSHSSEISLHKSLESADKSIQQLESNAAHALKDESSPPLSLENDYGEDMSQGIVQKDLMPYAEEPNLEGIQANTLLLNKLLPSLEKKLSLSEEQEFLGKIMQKENSTISMEKNIYRRKFQRLEGEINLEEDSLDDVEPSIQPNEPPPDIKTSIQPNEPPPDVKSFIQPNRISIPQSAWPTKFPNLTQKTENERSTWASSRLFHLYRRTDLMNHNCADCAVPMHHPDSIYASFYMKPVVNKRKKKRHSSNETKGKKSLLRSLDSLESILGDIHSHSSSSEFESDALDENRNKDDDDRPAKNINLREVMKKSSRPQSSSSNIWSSKSSISSAGGQENGKNPLYPSFSFTRRKSSIANNRMIHIADFKSLHLCFGAAGGAAHHIPSKKKGLVLHPPKTFIQQHGVFVCKDCSFAHNLLGRKVTTVKSVYATTPWSEDELKIMETSGGNAYAHGVLEAHVPMHWRNRICLNDESTMEERITYIKAKYDLLAFIFPYGPLSERSKWEILHKKRISDVQNTKNKSSTHRNRPSALNLDGPSARHLERSIVHLPERLIDYFCVVGATRNIKTTGMPPSTISSLSKNIINIELESKVWDCFPLPENSHPDMPLPSYLPNFAFPNGCRPRSQKKEPHFFTFVLSMEYTNAKVYGSALLVYEDVVYMDQIMDCLHKGGYTKTTIVRKGQAISTQEEQTPKQNIKNNRQKLYLPKALIVLSHYPFINLHRSFLQQIYLLSHTELTPLPIERYISNFCTDIPLPPQGKIRIKFGYFDDVEKLNISFNRPAKNALPLVGQSFRPLFTSLSVSNILVIFGCLLQEVRVVLCSKHISMLAPITEAFRSVLFPFVWQGLYIPVLPYSMMDILQSPTPFLIGIYSKYLVDVKKQHRPNGVVFVDVDKDIVHLGFEEGETASMERRTPKLPDKEVEKLKSKLDQYGGLAYLAPAGGQQGRLTSGLGLETVVNSHREKYAHQTVSLEAEKADKDKRQETIGQLRISILNKVDEAFVNDEHLRKIHFPTSTLGIGAMFEDELNSRSKQKRKASLGRPAPEARKSSLFDPDVDEKGGFSATEIRQAFLRFFAVILRSYEKYLVIPDENDDKQTKTTFDATNFLKKSANPHDNSWEFLSKFINTTMFKEFVKEKIEDPSCFDIMLFDETIIVRKNMSKKNKLKGGYRKTPFLSDKTDWDLEPHAPRPPSSFNLPSSGAKFFKKKFPRLQADFFSPPRKMKQWPSESYQRRITNTYPLHDEVSSKIFISSPFSIAPERDLLWSLIVTAYREPTPSQESAEIKKEERNKQYVQKMNLYIKSSKTLTTAIPIADQMIKASRATNTYILWGITKLQGLYRMIGVKEYYRRIYSYIIILQKNIRDFLFRRKYGSTFKGCNARARDIQRIFRGYSDFLVAVERRRAQSVIFNALKTFSVRLMFLKLRHSASKLASCYRERHVRVGFLQVKYVTAMIQAQVRGWLRRKEAVTIRRERLLYYRKQLFDLWRRSATPLSYRAKFWKLLSKNCFLYAALHEEELVRVWGVLGITVTGTVTVFEKCKEIQTLLDANKIGESNELVPLFPAEMTPKKGEQLNKQQECLNLSKIRLAAERQKLYCVLKDMDDDNKRRVYSLFNLDDIESRKKERIVKCLWEFRSLIKPSIVFILKVYEEYGHLRNFANASGISCIFNNTRGTNIPSSSILKKFNLDLNSHEGKTYDIVKRRARNMAVLVRLKLDERIQKDLVGTTKASFQALTGLNIGQNKIQTKSSRKRGKRNRRSRKQSHNLSLAELSSIKMDKRTRLKLARTYISKTPRWSH